jgi:hypothetical protein
MMTRIRRWCFHIGLVPLAMAYYPLKRATEPWVFVGICLLYVFALAALHAKVNRAKTEPDRPS